jgi:YVTN family beta-propeller protein
MSAAGIDTAGVDTAVTASADGTTAYVSNYKDNSVSAVDLGEMDIVTTVPTGDGPHGLVYLDATGRD